MSSEDLTPIEAPASEHYRATDADPISMLTVEEKKGFFKGSAIKYIHRYDRKNGIEDLRKAEFYLRKMIELSEKERLMGGEWNAKEKPALQETAPIEDSASDEYDVSLKCEKCVYNGTHAKCPDSPIYGCEYYKPIVAICYKSDSYICLNCRHSSIKLGDRTPCLYCNRHETHVLSDGHCPDFALKIGDSMNFENVE